MIDLHLHVFLLGLLASAGTGAVLSGRADLSDLAAVDWAWRRAASWAGWEWRSLAEIGEVSRG